MDSLRDWKERMECRKREIRKDFFFQTDNQYEVLTRTTM